MNATKDPMKIELFVAKPCKAGGESAEGFWLYDPLKLVHRSSKTLEDIDEMFARSKNTVANTLEEAIKHECGHAKLIKGVRIEQIEDLYEELGKIYIKGISRKAYSDGAECIAEVEVLLFKGDDVPEEAMELYNKYMKRKQND